LLLQSLNISIFQLKKADTASLAASLSRSLFSEIGIIYPLKSGKISGRIDNIADWQATLSNRPLIFDGISDKQTGLIVYDVALEINIQNSQYKFHTVKNTSNGTMR
jgi:hypothetical protein